MKLVPLCPSWPPAFLPLDSFRLRERGFLPSPSEEGGFELLLEFLFFCSRSLAIVALSAFIVSACSAMVCAILSTVAINKPATICALPPSSVKNILYGRSTDPKILTIKKICDGLDITLAEFFATPEFDALEQEIK